MINLNIRRIVMIALICLLAFSIPIGDAQEASSYFTPPQWSGDGGKVAIVLGNIVQIYSAQNDILLYSITDHMELVSMVAWNPDSTILATASYDQTVKLWNASDGSLLRTLNGHEDAVVFVTWSPDGKQVISSVFDSSPTLFVWDMETGSLLARHNGGTISGGSFSLDGKYLAITTLLNVFVLDGTSFQVIASSERVPCCPNTMYSIAWDATSTKLVTGSINGLVTIWDAATAETVTQFQANAFYAVDSREVSDLALSWVRAVSFTPDGNHVLAISGDGTLREWAVDTGTLLQETQVAPLATAAFSPYGGQLAYLDASLLGATEAASLQTAETTEVFQIVPVLPSLERLASIQAACNAQSDVAVTLAAPQSERNLDAYIAQVEAAPVDALPPGCAADLLAVARALKAG